MDFMNPLNYVTSAEYVTWWQRIFMTLLNGFWSRVFASTFFGLTLWFWVRRRQMLAGALFLIITSVVAYGYPLFKWVGVGK